MRSSLLHQGCTRSVSGRPVQPCLARERRPPATHCQRSIISSPITACISASSPSPSATYQLHISYISTMHQSAKCRLHIRHESQAQLCVCFYSPRLTQSFDEPLRERGGDSWRMGHDPNNTNDGATHNCSDTRSTKPCKMAEAQARRTNNIVKSCWT